MHLITSQYYCVYPWYRRVPVVSEMPRQKSRGIEEFLPVIVRFEYHYSAPLAVVVFVTRGGGRERRSHSDRE